MSVPSYPENCPCRGCNDRLLGCHGTCQAYAQFKSDVAAFNEYRKKEIAKYVYGIPYQGRRK